MKNFNLSKVITLFLLCICSVSTANAQNYLLEDENADPLYFDFIYEPPAQRTNFVKDELVLLYPADKDKDVEKITQKYGLKAGEKTVLASVNTGMLVANTQGKNPLKLSDQINEKEESVEAGTNNLFRPASRASRNAYSMYDTGVRYVHKTTKGEGISICMVDTPIDKTHPSLKKASIKVFDLFNVDRKNPVSTLHGTNVAGVLVSQNGHIGIAPKANLYAVGAFRTQTADPTSLSGSSADVAKGLDECIKQKVDVINLSFTGGKDTLVGKMVRKALRNGIIVVSAAGNGGRWGSTIYPAVIPGVITATAVDRDKKLFSMADKGNFIDYAAPGVNILTTAPGGKYKLATGTSISSAHLSGVIALLLSQKDRKSVEQVLQQTAVDLGTPGRDQEYGDGLIDAGKALSILR